MKEIKDFYCNGFFGRRYDLRYAKIVDETETSITVKTEEGEVLVANFQDEEEKDAMVYDWTNKF